MEREPLAEREGKMTETDETMFVGINIAIAAGKPKRVALAACMWKLLTMLNAMLMRGAAWRPTPA